MFTTIEKLRASSAMQSRVDVLEAHLKATYPAYTPQMHFPLFEIGLSNGDDDMEWVLFTPGTHSTDSVPEGIRTALGDTSVLLRKGFISAAFGTARRAASDVYTEQAQKYMELLDVDMSRIVIMCDKGDPALAWFKQHFLAFCAARSLAAVETITPVTNSSTTTTPSQDASFVAPHTATDWQAAAEPSWANKARESCDSPVDNAPSAPAESSSSGSDSSCSSPSE